MIIFNPLDVIKASDINANFADADNRLNDLETLAPLAYASGTISNATGVGYKALSEAENTGITFDGTNKYTVVTKGVYFICFQQLIQTGAGSANFYIRINGSDTNRAWVNGSTHQDMFVHRVDSLDVGDTIQLHQGNTISASWGGNHSQYSIILIRGVA